jgi:biopolymer transport protein ExbD
MPIAIRKGWSTASVSMTPMIDMVFLLLIFFLVAARLEEEERDLEVALPQASQSQPTIDESQEMFVSVTPAGEYYVDGRPLDARHLAAVLEDAYQANPGRQHVTIRADRDSRTRHVVAVMNACNEANIRDYSLATE